LLYRHWPLAAALALLFAIVVFLLIVSLDAQDGRLVYALDDPYIHMAIARHLVQDGVWGVTPHAFTAASSSPVWTLLLAATYTLIGPNEVAPLILNLVSATLVLALVYGLCRAQRVPPGLILITLLAVIFLTPLPALIFSGQEHTLHLLLTLALVWLAARVMVLPEDARREQRALLLIAAALPVLRYEGLFLVAVVCALLALHRRWRTALATGAIAGLPLLVCGTISVHNGGYWLPNPVIIKSDLAYTANAADAVESVLQLFSYPYLRGLYWELFKFPNLHLTLLVILALGLTLTRKPARTAQLMLVMFVAAALLHLRLARVGSFYRYEAYLMGLGITVIAAAGGVFADRLTSDENSRDRALRMIVLGLLSVLILFPALNRAWDALAQTPDAMHNIYSQQVQMGLFLRDYYNGGAVALNDIGAVCYLADIHLLDLWGLGTMEVAEAKRGRYYSRELIDGLAVREGIQIAIIYEDAIAPYGGVPQWIKVGEWTIPNRVTAAAATVSFYAVDPFEAQALAAHLYDFSARMPRDVTQTLFFDPR
jgi:hypothetical protein